MTHTFQFDPNTILGVAAGASLREIRDAYHRKSLKHHPDTGGDEWAFRMVVRSYEILTTARVVDRASEERTPPPAARPAPQPRSTPTPPPPPPRASWTDRFRAAVRPDAVDPARPTAPPSQSATGPKAPTAAEREASNLSGWGGAARPHTTQALAELARIVSAELLILRFELECSLDLFARNPEDRNLSCTLHITWPLEELIERKEPIADAARLLGWIDEAFRSKAVRKHALTKRSQTEGGRFVGWLTFPTAVMASEALEAFREALVSHNVTIEKQIREMALPRQW